MKSMITFGNPDKDTLVLLHGGGLSWWNYREAATLLARDYHVVLPVLDGHSGSGTAFTSIEANAARLIGLIDAQFGGQVTALAGLSLGAQVALEMLSQRGDICRFALVESALVKPMKLTNALIASSVGMSYGLIQKRWFSKLQAAYLGIPESLFPDYYRDTCAISRADMIAFLQANSVYEAKPTLSQTTAKVKILAGGREQKAIMDSARLLRDLIPESELQILPGLGHGELSLREPERYARILKSWIQPETRNE